MNEADSQKAAFGFHAESFRQVERIVITIPREDATLAEKRSDFGRRVIREPQRNGRAAFVKAFQIADTEKLQIWDRKQPFGQARKKRHLVLARRAVSRQQRAAPVTRGGIAMLAQLREVIDCRADPRD